MPTMHEQALSGPATGYAERRAWLERYFDRTAAHTWARLTSDAPLGRVHASVRAGREQMRRTLLGLLPERLDGRRVLDAGCGTGAAAVELARRGAEVVAIDLAPTMVHLAAAREPADVRGRIRWVAGDMLDERLGRFDHTLAMDSLIHYRTADMVGVLEQFGARTGRSVLFTFAPNTVLLGIMHAIGNLFPRGQRSPRIVPVRSATLHRRLSTSAGLTGWRLERTIRVRSGFYTSQAVELVSKDDRGGEE